eukprot:gene14376-20226_t
MIPNLTGCKMEPGMRYATPDLLGSPSLVATAHACAELCAAREGCGYFTFIESVCHLKSEMTSPGESSSSTRIVDPSAYSGICEPQVCTKKCNPKNNWQDSYEVGGRCYCWFGDHSFDHNIATVLVPTRAGIQTVQQ